MQGQIVAEEQQSWVVTAIEEGQNFTAIVPAGVHGYYLRK